ncbi:protein-L-isoaspartate(D-aspartate) O-methyltransferase-like [Watersipora subatra]|uniref:protein-L-isoaspartate(D-aspartate) O-methyltransferase-like n=1 Tax=Watersipora subatra TaxID=2589382 RepID=UPI00355BDEC1
MIKRDLLVRLVLIPTLIRQLPSMAWRSTGSTNQELLSNLKKNGVLKNQRVIDAMLRVDRGHFTDRDKYVDAPQPIGYKATISAPHMHAHALELLADQLVEGNRVLDVGSGTGYLTACMSIMVGDKGKVVGIDHIEGIVKDSLNNVARDPQLQALIDSGRMELLVGDGRLGYPPAAPYNAIHVGAAAATIPQALTSQLAPGGRMIIPHGPQGGHQELLQIDKKQDGTLTQKSLMGVIYVPLTDSEKQWPKARSDL